MNNSSTTRATNTDEALKCSTPTCPAVLTPKQYADGRKCTKCSVSAAATIMSRICGPNDLISRDDDEDRRG